MSEEQNEIARLKAIIHRVRVALDFVEPIDRTQLDAAIAADAHLSLRKCAKKHGVGVSVVRTIRAALAASSLTSDAVARASQSEGAIENAPDDLKSHRMSWRNGLLAVWEKAEVSPPDIDDKSYWLHEIEAFDRTFNVLFGPMPAGYQAAIRSEGGAR